MNIDIKLQQKHNPTHNYGPFGATTYIYQRSETAHTTAIYLYNSM